MARTLLSLAWMLSLALAATGQTSIVYAQYGSLLGPTTRSAQWPPSTNIEAADDFVANGTVSLVTISGGVCYQCAPPPVNLGAFVRFYDGSQGVPGTLQQQYYIPNVVNQSNLEMQMALPSPFTVSGRHFLAVQLVSQIAHAFEWRVANPNTPNGSPAIRRNRAIGGPWQYVTSTGVSGSDLAFVLYGSFTPFVPPTKPDPCGVWSRTSLPLPVGATRANVRDVAAGPTGEVWTVGGWNAGSLSTYNLSGGAAVWRLNGAGWSIVPVPDPGLQPVTSPMFLSCVETLFPNDVWIGGSRSAIVNTSGFVGRTPHLMRFDGTSWNTVSIPIPTPSQGEIRASTQSGPNDLWFVGEDANTTVPTGGLALRWDGNVLTAVPTPRPAFITGVYSYGDVSLYGVSAAAVNDVWAIGGDSDDNGRDFGFVLHFDGSTWAHVPAPTPQNTLAFEFTSLVALPGGRVWISGLATTTTISQNGTLLMPFLLYRDANGWALLTPFNAFDAMMANGPDDVTAASWYGLANGGTNGFAVTQSLPTGGGATWVASFANLGACDAWAGGSFTTSPLGEPQPMVLRRAPTCSSLQYGLVLPPPFSLDFVPPFGSQGTVQLRGGTPSASALVVISTGPERTPMAGGATLLVDLGPGAWFSLTIPLDPAGAADIPIDLQSPGLAGLALYIQAAHAPLVVTNGLRLLFCP